MNLPRIFANAFARRVAYVVVALVLAWMGIGQAHAAYYEYPDQGSAFAGCNAQGNSMFPQSTSTTTERRFADCIQSGKTYSVRYKNCNKGTETCGAAVATSEIHRWSGGSCLDRTGDGNGGVPKNAISVGSPPCINGCAYANSNGTFSTRFDFGTGQSVDFYSAQGMKPTGGVCGGPPPPSPPTCEPDGTIKQCVKDDGRHCVVASNGTTMCWQPGETGTKVSGNVAVTKAPANVAIKPPPVPPKNNGDWVLQGTSTTNVTNNSGSGAGATNNYNNGTYISNYGTEGKGGGAEGDGEGEGEGEGESSGSASGIVTASELYEKRGKQVGEVMGMLDTKIRATEIISGVESFFSVSAGGSCPTWTLPATPFWDAMTIDYQCQQPIAGLLVAAGYLLLGAICVLGVRIALA